MLGWSIISDCVVSGNAKGIVALGGGVVRDCLAVTNGVAGIEVMEGGVLVTQNHVELNGQDDPTECGGIVTGTLSRSTVTDNHLDQNHAVDVRSAGTDVFMRNRVRCGLFALTGDSFFPLDGATAGRNVCWQ